MKKKVALLMALLMLFALGSAVAANNASIAMVQASASIVMDTGLQCLVV